LYPERHSLLWLVRQTTHHATSRLHPQRALQLAPLAPQQRRRGTHHHSTAAFAQWPLPASRSPPRCHFAQQVIILLTTGATIQQFCLTTICSQVRCSLCVPCDHSASAGCAVYKIVAWCAKAFDDADRGAVVTSCSLLLPELQVKGAAAELQSRKHRPQHSSSSGEEAAFCTETLGASHYARFHHPPLLPAKANAGYGSRQLAGGASPQQCIDPMMQ
jgi:hypothetical protein